MHDLAELVALFNSDRPSGGEWQKALFESGSKLEQLFQAIADNASITDQDAARLIYGQGAEASSKYGALKSRLKARLIDGVFLLDQDSENSRDRRGAQLLNQKKWAAAMLLLAKGARPAAVDLLQQILRQSVQFELTDLRINALQYLRQQHIVPGEKRAYYLQNRDEHRRMRTLLNAENEAEDLFNDFMDHYADTDLTRRQRAAIAEKSWQKVSVWMDEFDSYRLHLSGRLLQMNAAVFKGDYHATAEICRSAIAFFESKPYHCNAPFQAFYYQWAVCCIQLSRHEEGRSILQKYQSLYPEGSFNWYKLLELQFILDMHTRHYVAAAQTFQIAVQQKSFTKQPDFIQESWKLYEAYLHYLGHIGKIDSTTLGSSFKWSKFLNEIPQFERDKRGRNVPVLILQTLFLLAGDKYPSAVDRTDALKKYVGRYLRNDEMLRSNCMLNMLIQIPERGFHRVAVERHTQKYAQKLAENPLEIANQAHEIEVIPYEDLWQMALQSLNRS